jgi:hypothetical protein
MTTLGTNVVTDVGIEDALILVAMAAGMAKL